MKILEKSKLLLEGTYKRYIVPPDFAFNFSTSVIILRLIAVLLLIHGEYSYLTLPICQNKTQQFALLYPYAAFAGVILLGLTQIFLSDFKDLTCIRIELFINLLLGIVMFGISWLTLRYCLRPAGLFYLLPEIYCTLVPLVLFIHAAIWYYRHTRQRDDNDVIEYTSLLDLCSYTFSNRT